MAFIDVVKFNAPSDDILVWKYQSEKQDELRFGTQLIVNESQECIFVKGGQALDIFGPGTHTLSPGNIPLLRKLVNMPFGGQTPFTAEIWFINKTVKRNLPWGTKVRIPVVDPKFGFPVRVGAFGRWGIRIADSRSFLTQLVGSQIGTDSNRVEEYFIGEIIQKFSESLAQFIVDENIPITETTARLTKLSLVTTEKVRAEFARFGIELINFNIENINIPDEEYKQIQDVLRKKMEMEQLSQVEVKQGYITSRTFDVLDKAAANESGAAGAMLAGGLGMGVGLGTGLPLGQQVGKSMNIQQQQASCNDDGPMERLQKLKQFLEAGLISQEDYDAKKKDILSAL